jgi:hypothetical protein
MEKFQTVLIVLGLLINLFFVTKTDSLGEKTSRQEAFKPFDISWANRTVLPWTAQKYLAEVKGSTVVREYVLQELDQRSYLLCPRGEKTVIIKIFKKCSLYLRRMKVLITNINAGFFIGEITHSLLVSDEQLQDFPLIPCY